MKSNSAARKLRAVKDVEIPDPFGTAAEDYIENGWVTPVPAGHLPFRDLSDAKRQELEDSERGVPTGKENIVSGLSGWKNPWPPDHKFYRRVLRRYSGKGHNLALWVPPGVIGIDIDAYKEDGANLLRDMEKAYGKLPPTLISSARADGVSGIRFYRIPEDVSLYGLGKFGDGIEIVHRGTRIAVVAPSWHEGNQSYYRWYDRCMPDGNGSLDAPDIDDLADLPDRWIVALDSGEIRAYMPKKDLGTKRESQEEIKAWYSHRRFDGDQCALVASLVREHYDAMDTSGQQPAMISLQWRLLALAFEGHSGVRSALEQIKEQYKEAAGDRRGQNTLEREWVSAFDGAAKGVMYKQDNHEFLGFPRNCDCSTPRADGRKKERLNAENFDPNVDVYRAYASIAPDESGEGVYLSSGNLTHVWGGKMLPMNKASLRVEVSDRMDVVKWKGSVEEGGWQACFAQDNFLESMLVNPRRSQYLPTLDRMVSTPYFAWVDGKPTLIAESGYHPETQTYLELDPSLENAVDAVRGTDADVTRARKILYSVIGKFPFDSAASRTHLVAMLTQHFVRELIDGPTPLYAISAPEPGSGKTFLASIANILATGEKESEENRSGWLGDMDAQRKDITSKINRNGAPALLLIDNVEEGRVFGDGWFSSSFTSRTYNDRPVHSGVELSVPNKWIWVATGNNFQLTPETARRSVSIRLDAKHSRPAERKFSFDPVERAMERREKLVWAVLTFVSAWAAKGGKGGPRELASFLSYSAVLGGITANAGYRYFLGNRARSAEFTDTEESDIIPLFEEMLDVFGSGSKNSAKPGQLAQLPSAANYAVVHNDSAASNMGVAMAAKIGVRRDLNGHTYILRRRITGGNAYFLEREDGVAEGPAAKKLRFKGNQSEGR